MTFGRPPALTVTRPEAERRRAGGSGVGYANDSVTSGLRADFPANTAALPLGPAALSIVPQEDPGPSHPLTEPERPCITESPSAAADSQGHTHRFVPWAGQAHT